MTTELVKPGTYAGLKFSQSSANSLESFAKLRRIPNALPVDKLHVTLLYSRKHLPNYKALGDLSTPLVATPKEFVVWETNGEGKPKTRCLILKLESPAIVAIHNILMYAHEATYDYPEYSPHVTLSYDIGDMHINHFKIGEDLPQTLELVHEYQEDLNLAWANTL